MNMGIRHYFLADLHITTYATQAVFNKICLKKHDRMSKRILRNRFSVKYQRSNETLGKSEEDF